jgi:hypothetical protein
LAEAVFLDFSDKETPQSRGIQLAQNNDKIHGISPQK